MPTLPAPPADGLGALQRAVQRWASWGVGLLCLLGYGLTLRRGVGGGDSGELTMVAAELGIAHPPGYPLYTLLSHPFAYLPGDNLAANMGASSACCAAAAVALLFASLRRWTRDAGAALLGAGLFATSPLFWHYATVVEVFALHLLFCAGLLYASLRLRSGMQPRLIFLSAVWLGLGLGHHHTLLFYGMPFAVWLFAHLPPQRRFYVSAQAALLTVAAAGLPYLYLLVAAQRVPRMGWGDTHNLTGLVVHMMRGDYGTFALSRGATSGTAHLGQRLSRMVATWPQELGWVAMALLVVAALDSWQRRRQVGPGALWLTAGALYAIIFSALNNVRVDHALALGVQARFDLQLNLLVCVAVGVGAAALGRRMARPQLGLGVVLLWLGGQTYLHWPTPAAQSAGALEAFGRATLGALPPGAMVISTGDHILGTMRYLQRGGALRPDVDMIDAAQLGYSWSGRYMAKNFARVRLPQPGVWAPGGYDMAALMQSNRQRPLFLLNWQSEWDQSLAQCCTTWAWGFARQVLPRGARPPDDAWRQANITTFAAWEPYAQARVAADSWEAYVQHQYRQSMQGYGSALLIGAVQTGTPDRAQLKEGIAVLERVAQLGPVAAAELYKNLGAAYQHLAGGEPGYGAAMIDAWQRYLRSCASESCSPPEQQAIAHMVAQAQGAAAQL